jgi:hypothetical protein
MQTLRQRTIGSLLLLLLAPIACAQKNDFGFTLGGYVAASSPLDIGAAWALEGSYARRVASVPLISLSAELPVAESFTSSVPTLNGLTLARSYTSFFITPGARIRLAPSFPISPYIAAGLGYGRFNRKLFDGSTSASGAFVADIAGGLDIKILPFISLRGEIRDFNSTAPGVESLFAAGRQNNLFITLGVGARF